MEKDLKTTEYADSYSTGNVQVPKDQRNMVTAVLLAGVCLVCILTLLVFVSKYLFADFWSAGEKQSSILFIKDMQFSQRQLEEEGYADIARLGIHGRVLTSFDQQYFDLPEGVYITRTTTLVPDLQVGDVLMAVNSVEISDPDALNSTIESYESGTTLTLKVYRAGKELEITTTIQKERSSN